MIFKTYETDLDGISNKLGFSKRSFAEWGTQVSQSFNNAGKGLKGFKEAFVAAFSVQKKTDEVKLIESSTFNTLFGKSAEDFFKSFDQYGSQSISTLTQWCDQIGVTDKTMKAYLVDCMRNQVPTSFEGYNNYVKSAIANNKQLTLSAKAGAVALDALAIAGNMAAMWAITKGIQLAVKGIDNLAHSAEYCKERVDKLMSSYQSALDKANSNAKTVEDLAVKYERLSKGINNLGENVSLTTDEYTEYNKIVNQIADMFPTLVHGYTNEGNAILSLKGNVEQLRDAYKEAQQEAYNMLIVSGKDSNDNDIIKNYQNIIKENEKFEYFLSWFNIGFKDLSPKKYIEYIELLQKAMFSSDEEYEELLKRIKKVNGFSGFRADENLGIKQYSNLLNVINKIGFKENLTDEDKRNINKNAKSYIERYQAEIKLALKDVQILANAYLMTNEDYAKLDEQSKNAASIIVNRINEDIASGFESNKDVGAYVIGIVDCIKDNSDIQDALVGLFTLDTSDMQPDKAKALVDQYVKYIVEHTDVLGEDIVEVKVRLGFEDVDIIASNYHLALKKAYDKFAKKTPYATEYNSDELESINKFAEKNSINTQDKIAFLRKCIEESETLEEVMEKYLETSSADKNQISLFKEQIDKVNTYQSELKELYAALNLIRTREMTPSDMDELIKKFPELSGYVDDFDNGIKKLINDTLQLFGKSFNGLTGEDSLRSIYKFSVMQEEITNSIETTTNAINNLTSSYQTLDKAVREYNENGYLSLKTLENLMKLKPEYLASIIDEEGNLKDVTEVYKELIDLKLKEFETDAYKKANSVQAQLRDKYKGYLVRSEDVGIYDKEYEEKHKEYTDKFKDSQITLEQELKFIQSARANLDKVAEGSGFGDITSSTSDFEKHIDWASYSIDILQNKVSSLQDKLSNVSGYDNQIEAIKKIIEAQESLKTGYDKTKEIYQKKYENILNDGILAEQGLTTIIKENIENGENFSIEDFIANNVNSGDTSIQQQIYEAIQEAIDWYNKKNDAEKNILKIKAEIDESEMSKHDVWRKKWETQIDRIKDNQKFINNTIDFDGGKGKDRDKYYNALIRDETEIRKIVFERWKYETKLLKGLEPENDKYAEQEKTVQECANNLAECAKNIKDWQLDIVHLKLEAIDEEIDSINDKIKDNQNEIDEKDKLISGAIGILNQEVKVQEGLRDVIQDRIDALQKENDEYERALNLEKAKYELQRAYSQRTVKFYSGKEQGFIYTQDDEAVRDAQENLDKLEYEETIHALQKQVDYYNDIIDNLNDIKDIWSNISSAAQEFLDIENLISKYGVDIKDSILSGDYDTNSLTQFYKDLLNRKDEFNNSLEKQEDLRTDIEEIIERFQNGTITYEQCLTDIGILLGDVYDVSHTIIEQSVKDIVESTEIIPTEVNKANDAVKELEKNTQESASNINSELSAVSDNADKKSSETTEKITKNLEEELNNQRIILENFYGYVDNIFLNIRFSALDNFKKITDGMKETIESVKEEIEGIVTDTNNSVQSYVFSQPLKTSSVKNRPNKDSFALMKSGGLLTTKYKELDKFANSIGEDHITLLGYKEGERILTPAENEIWEKMNDIGISLMPNIAPDISSHSIKFPDIGAIQNKTTPVVQHVNVTIPNITNENGFNKFKQELERLQLDALQYTNRR